MDSRTCLCTGIEGTQLVFQITFFNWGFIWKGHLVRSFHSIVAIIRNVFVFMSVDLLISLFFEWIIFLFVRRSHEFAVYVCVCVLVMGISYRNIDISISL